MTFNCEILFRSSDTLTNTIFKLIPKMQMEYPVERFDAKLGVTVAHSVGFDHTIGENTRRVAVHPKTEEDLPDLWPTVSRYAIAHYFNHGELPSTYSAYWSCIQHHNAKMTVEGDSLVTRIKNHLAVLGQLLKNVEPQQVVELSIVKEGVSIIRSGVRPIGQAV